MGSGSHHGGSTHSGSFHSSGGGSHSFGGGGGGFHSSGGGGYHSSGGGYSGHDGGGYSSGNGLFELSILMIAGLIYGLAKIADGAVPGLNLVNLGMFLVTGFVYFFVIKNEAPRYDSLKMIKKGNLDFSRGTIARTPSTGTAIHMVEDNCSWVSGPQECHYSISLYDREFRKENARKVYDTIKRTPRILWTPTGLWLFFSIICFVGTFFFYEGVIPYFERAIMTDEAFKFMDYLIFYLPAGLSLLFAVTSVVLHILRDRVLYKCAKRSIYDNNAALKLMKTEDFIACRLSEKWYYNTCPNCGAVPAQDLTTCDKCGTSLEADFIGGGKPTSFHRISRDAEKEKT